MPNSNVSASEINKFSKLASTWWDTQGACRPLHELNPLRLTFIQRFIDLKHQKAIDVGCGGGILTEALAQAGAQTTGIDMGHDVIQVAKLHSVETNIVIDYQKISVENIAQTHACQFNVVTCMEMLEHVPDPLSVVKACADLTALGGYVFFSTINRNPMAYLQAIIGAEYILGLLPRGTHDYQKFIKPSELADYLRQAKLKLVSLSGLTYNPLIKRYRLTEDAQVNYLLCAQKNE